MRKNILTIILLMVIGLTASAQYSCSKFYPFAEGAKSELTLYDAKGKTSGMVEYHITSIKDNGSSQTATMKTELTDKKGNTVTGSEYEATCSNGVVSIDFKSLISPEMTKTYEGMNMDTEITGTNLELPNDLTVGQSLPDAEINIKISMSGMNMNMLTSITDRKVLSKENLTTPAGTFDCYVLTQTMVMKSMANNQTRTSKQWVAEGVGVVKTEDYNRRGKLDGYTLLTSFSK